MIEPVFESKKYMDIAFQKANALAKLSKYSKIKDRINRKKSLERDKINTIKDVLCHRTKKIVNSFPSFEQLDEFYEEIIESMVDLDKTKKSLSKIWWASEKITELSFQNIKKIGQMEEKDKIIGVRKAYYGRVSSVMQRINKDLIFIEDVRKKIRELPDVKDVFTVCIAGFPNVGKSTLLSKLTDAKPKINNYSFTTKRLNIGYFSKSYHPIQVIDTPGTLNRFNKMNNIEKQAYLAVKLKSNIVVYVFDLTMQYPIDEQKKLLIKIENEGKKVIIFLSKTDILPKDVVSSFIQELGKKEIYTNIELLKEKLKESI